MDELAWAEEDETQAQNATEQESDEEKSPYDQNDDDAGPLWTLAVSLFSSAHYPLADQLVKQWTAHFEATSQRLLTSRNSISLFC